MIALAQEFLEKYAKMHSRRKITNDLVRMKHNRKEVQSFEVWTEDFLPLVLEYRLPSIQEIQLRVSQDLEKNNTSSSAKEPDFASVIDEFLESCLGAEIGSFRLTNEIYEVQEFGILKKSI